MNSDTPRDLVTDDDGIPLLFDIIKPGALLEKLSAIDAQAEAQATSAKRVSAQQIVEELDLTDSPDLKKLVEEIATDLDAEITWKLEKVLKQAVAETVHEAMRALSASIHKSVVTHLTLMMPEVVKLIKEEPTSSDKAKR
jgi:hypothetical protein